MNSSRNITIGQQVCTYVTMSHGISEYVTHGISKYVKETTHTHANSKSINLDIDIQQIEILEISDNIRHMQIISNFNNFHIHIMWVKQCHEPSPSHHPFYRWYGYHSQSCVVKNCIVSPTLIHIKPCLIWVKIPLVPIHRTNPINPYSS
jgi:hypothetical protein